MVSFDDQEGQIWYNGELVPWKDTKLHVLTHGLHYASCVFEGERVYNGEVFKLREHTQRLIDSAHELGFEIPYSLEELEQATRDTVTAQGYPDAYVRPVAWRGSEMMGVSAQTNTINIAIAVWEWPSYFSPEARMRGIKLKTSKWRRPSPETAPVHAKAAGLYMICTLAKHEAERKGFQDALMMDYRGYVAEATGANVFFVDENGTLHTPIADCFLNGITRRSVIEMAKSMQIEVIERHIEPEELVSMRECFLTGTAAEVTPVSRIGDYDFTPGNICRKMVDGYINLVNA